MAKRDTKDVAIAKAMRNLIGAGDRFESIEITVGDQKLTVNKTNRQQLEQRCDDVISGKKKMNE